MVTQKAKLLLVDDEPLQLKVLQTMVDTLPYSLEVVSCGNGQEAIDYLEEPTNAPLPDIIITDYLMPVVDGLELLAYVRKHNKYKSVSVLMVSAFDEPEIQKKALELGVDDFLRRPLNRYEMQARCNSFIHFSHHVKGTLEHAVFYDQRFLLSNRDSEQSNEDALEVFTRFLAALKNHPACYRGILADISRLLTQKLKLDEFLCQQTAKAVALHDIGLTLAEQSGSKSETPYRLGSELLQDFHDPVFQLAAEINRYQDEWFDGSGAPEKINGINIPLAARIAAIAIFIAKTACMETELSDFRAILKTLTEQSGKRYDPELIQIIHDNRDAVVDIIEKNSS